MERRELSDYKASTGYSLGQLEIDYYQHFILARLFEKFNTIYFKGGTALQKVYGIKRFSDDLDFNYDEIDIDEIMRFIEKLFKTSAIDRHSTRFGTSFSIRIEGMLFDGTERSRCKISFDFRQKDTYNPPLKQVIRPLYKDLPDYFLLALDEKEILAEKVRTILTRHKARDVYDLNELIRRGVKPDLSLINKKIRTYDLVFDRDEFERKLEEKRKVYDEEMKRLTRIYDDFDTCKKRILDAIISTRDA